MTPAAVFPRSPRTTAAAFSLTEIVIALGIISFAMVAIIGVLPAGMTASRDATDRTVVSAILESVHNRVKNERLEPGPASFSPAYFDERGTYIPADAPEPEQKSRLYRVDVNISDWHEQPEKTSSLKPITIAISWPVDGRGEPIGRDNPRTTVSYAVSTLTGPEWSRIDPAYVPKIEF